MGQVKLSNKKVLIIDFGSHSFKFVVAKQTKDKLILYKSIVIPISPNIYANGEILNEQDLGILIKETVLANKLKKLPIVCTVGSPHSALKILQLPKAKIADLNEIVRFEIQQYLPVDVAQYAVQTILMKTEAAQSTEEVKVLVGAIPLSFVEQVYHLLESIDLQPMAMDLQIHGMVKWVENRYKQTTEIGLLEKNILAVDIGHSQLEMSLYENGEFIMNRRLSTGGLQLDQKISRVFDLSMDDARQEKHQVADVSIVADAYSSEHRVLNVVQASLDEWITEVDKVIKFYKSRGSNTGIESIYLYGGSSRIQGIDKYFEKELGIKTRFMTDWGNWENDQKSEQSSDQNSAETYSIYMNAISASMRKGD